MSSKITVKQFKSLIRNGRVFDCVENTFKPQLNGSERIVDAAQGNGYFYRVTSEVADKRYWADMPAAKDIIESSLDGFGGVTVKLRLPAMAADGTVTLKFYMDAGEDFLA